MEWLGVEEELLTEIFGRLFGNPLTSGALRQDASVATTPLITPTRNQRVSGTLDWHKSDMDSE